MTTRDDELGRIEGEVGVLLKRVKRVIGERARMVHPDLGSASYLMLGQLEVSGPVRAADLAGALGHDKGGVSRHVQQLVDLGLVERRPDPEDRRAQLLVLTDEAVARLDAVRRERSARFDALLAEWSGDELATFADQLGRYNAALETD